MNWRRLGRVTLGLIAAIAVVAVAVWLTPYATAHADSEYRLALTDGNQTCFEGDTAETGGYKYSHDKEGIPVYTFAYHEGINIKVQSTTTDGTAIQLTSVETMASVKYNDSGDVVPYVVTARINDVDGNPVNYSFKIVISPRAVSLVWDESSLSAQYGMPIEPKVTPSVAAAGAVAVYAQDGNVFGTEYVKTQGVGKYTVTAKLQNPGNYTLADNTNTFDVVQYQGSISVEKDAYNGTYKGALNAVNALGASETNGLVFLCEYSADKKSWTIADKHLLPLARTYYVRFRYDGNSRNYKNFQTDAYTVTIAKADTTLVLDGTEMVVSYNADNDSDAMASAMYNWFGSGYYLHDEDGNDVAANMSSFSYRYRQNDEAEWGETPVDGVGDVQVRIVFVGNDNYNAADALDTTLHIDKATVRVSVRAPSSMAYGGLLTFAYDDDAETSFTYSVANTQFRAWVEAGHDATYTVAYRVQQTDGSWVRYEYDGETPPLPGDYGVTITLDSELYKGTSTEALIQVEHVAFAAEWIQLDNTQYEYGQTVSVSPTIVAEDVALDGGIWTVRYGQDGVWGADTSLCGTYDVEIRLQNDKMYSGVLTYLGAVVVAPKQVTLSVWDTAVEYGKKAYPQGYAYGTAQNKKDVWWAQGEVLTADVDAFLKSLTIYIHNGEKAVTAIDETFEVGDEGYALSVESTAVNYTVVTDYVGRLYVRTRTLRASVTGVTTLYEGASVRLGVGLDNYVDGEDVDALAACFELTYTENGTVLDGVPTSAGTYTVTPVLRDGVTLANYQVQAQSVKLLIKSLTLPTSTDEFGVTGQFETNNTLTIVKGVASRYSSEVSAVLSGYQALAVYEIQTPVSAKSGRITFRLLLPDNCRDPQVLYLEGNVWQTVAFTEQDGYAVFTQDAMASKYIVCSKAQINWLLIGLIAGGVVLAVGIAVVVIVMSKVNRQKRLAKETTVTVAAPTAGPRPNEDEELDSFIDTFDESTVERELTPAERIALREKEEKYQQYRARLQRMRTSDRTLQDTMQSLGLTGNEDEDAIIERMIAADEERARQVEEEMREEERARAEQEAAPTAVILEKREEVLEQKTFAPTQTDWDDDDDIDI